MLPIEVFLSHSSHDAPAASLIARLLRDHGVPVWYSPTSIVGAQQWHDEIGAALVRCDWFVLLLSPDAVASKWVKRELLYALENDRYSDRIVPVVLRQCSVSALSWTLSALQMIDLFSDQLAGCRSLLRVWGIGLRPEWVGDWTLPE